MSALPPTISVVICAYTSARWGDLVAAVQSVIAQTRPALETIVVIDHNAELLQRSVAFFGRFRQVRVVENERPRGLSGARNSGISHGLGEIIAFLDDDAAAAPDWLENLSAAYTAPNVVGVGGRIEPLWEVTRPGWFPSEFDWVVGCTYRGMPTTRAAIRNQIGANMSFRRSVFESLGGFRDGVGQIGTSMLRCDDTEFGIRVRQRWPDSRTIFEPEALVFHRVPGSRSCWRYYCSRCYTEGLAKAIIVALAGRGDGLASERSYVLRTLPLGVAGGIRSFMSSGDLMGLARASAIVTGLWLTTTGFMVGTVSRAVGMSDPSSGEICRFAPTVTSAPPDENGHST